MKRLNRATLATSIISCLLLSGCIGNGEGEKIGQVTKIARQGVFCKTWEGEIVRGGFSPDGNGVAGAPFHFTVRDEAQARKVREAMEKRLEVKISYSSELITLCQSESNSQFLTSIEIIDTRGPAVAAPSATGSDTVRADDDGRIERIEKLLVIQAELISELAASRINGKGQK